MYTALVRPHLEKAILSTGMASTLYRVYGDIGEAIEKIQRRATLIMGGGDNLDYETIG